VGTFKAEPGRKSETRAIALTGEAGAVARKVRRYSILLSLSAPT